jgi:hypothetical protein
VEAVVAVEAVAAERVAADSPDSRNWNYMAISKTETLIPESHSMLVVFSDHFGHEHKAMVPTHVVVEDPLKPFPVGPVNIQAFDAQLCNIEKMMRDRELAFLDHCLQHPEHASHPLVLSHPDHPKNVQNMQIVQISQNSPDFNALEKAVQKDCKDCG